MKVPKQTFAILLFLIPGFLSAQHSVRIPEIKEFTTSVFSKRNVEQVYENQSVRLKIKAPIPIISSVLTHNLNCRSFGMLVPHEPIIVLVLDPIDKAIYGETISLYISHEQMGAIQAGKMRELIVTVCRKRTFQFSESMLLPQTAYVLMSYSEN